MSDTIRSRERQRKDRQIQEVTHDPYQERYKPRDPAACPTCGAVFDHGHWRWMPKPEGAHDHLCPACRRTQERFPAGFVTLEGEFLAAHRDEILHLARNEAQRAKSDHPLERIMDIQQDGSKTVISTTDLHLARRIGDAVHHAYQGSLDVKYSPDEYLIRVFWQR
jgi:hypothetical protein